jgi:hypothetical protein
VEVLLAESLSRWSAAGNYSLRGKSTICKCNPSPLQPLGTHAATCQGTVVAADPFQPAQVPPQSETAPGHYATHSVLPPSSTDDSDDSAPNENIDDRSQVARCGLCSRLFSRRSNPRPDNHGVDNSGVGGMSERRWETEDDSTLVTPTS